MLSRLVTPGDRIELQAVERLRNAQAEEKKVYISKVYDVLSDDRMEIIMPMEQTKLVLLPVDSEYDVLIYSENNVYQCFTRIIDRYRRNNVYILVVEMISNLRKFQRREYYRYSCALNMGARPLVEEEVKALEEKEVWDLTPGLPLKQSVIVDISGGGLRFVANHEYEENSLVYCNYYLPLNGTNKEYCLVGKVLSVKPVANKRGLFEHRVQYVDINTEKREEIIKYIFQEERKNRKRDSGLE